MRVAAAGLILAMLVAPVFAATPKVTLDQGALSGVDTGGINIFRGIPFAGDTGGSHRWQPPTPPPHWQGVRDATHFGTVCPQPSIFGGKGNGLEHMQVGEDCLNLNVYTPALHPKQALPVMVWIHGGSGVVGSGSFYDGSWLAQRGVVVVTINYRLGLFGQFAYPGLNASSPDALQGNYGLMDVLASLKWVQANIAAFGGNPANVTLFGQSQGSMDVTTLMASPMSQGLFQKAIAESGAVLQLGRGQQRYLDRSLPGSPSLESTGVAMAQAMLPHDKHASPSDLRSLSWQAVLKYQEATLPPNAMSPVIDGKLLPAPVGQRFAEGKALAIPLLIGTTNWEQSLFAHFQIPDSLMQRLLAGVPEATLATLYPGLQGQKLADQWIADAQFNAPVRYLANATARLGQPVWVYQFAHLSPTAVKAHQLGAAHADELPYLFDMQGSVHPGFMQGKVSEEPLSADEQRMVATMVGYWTQFAKTGDPNGPNLPQWPRWQSGGDGATQILDVPAHPVKALMGQRMKFHLSRYTATMKAEAVH